MTLTVPTDVAHVPAAHGSAASPAAAAARVRVTLRTSAPGHGTLSTPTTDTWLLGGLSVAVFAVVVTAELFRNSVPAVGLHLDNVAVYAASLALVVNYPHFMASYAVAYGRGADYIARNWVALLLVPATLAVVLLTGATTVGDNVSVGGATVEDFGGKTLGLCVQAMFLTVGWHYVKQTYGCARTGASMRQWPFTVGEANTLRWAMTPLWIVLWVRANAALGDLAYEGLSYPAANLPHWSIPAANVALAAGALVAVGVLGRAAWRNGSRPPAIVAGPLVAMYLWWVPAAWNPTFALLVPFFHSLQYLPFAVRVERNRHRASARVSNPAKRTALVAGAAIVAGWLVFEGIPSTFDHVVGPVGAPAPTPVSGGGVVQSTGTYADLVPTGVFVAAIVLTVFVNVHHYFIDHVAWRLRDPLVRRELLGP